MNIKEIVDKIVKEADLNPREYTVADRIEDVNSKYMELVELARQTASREPISGGETFSETFTLVEGSNEFTRTMPDLPIFRVDYQPAGSTRWCRVTEDQSRKIGEWCCEDSVCCDFKFFANEKKIFSERARAGTLRVTYLTGELVLFTAADYTNPNPPSPIWLPTTFHDLLWMYPALHQAELYKPDRVNYLERRIVPKQNLFDSHYSINSAWDSEYDTCEGPNYR